MLYKENDFLSLSALQHYIFCTRQCALIHVEQAWVENRFTAEGRVIHEHVHEQAAESRKDVRIERGMPLRSSVLGITGKADMVEFHKTDRVWLPYPVEYKRGKPKADNSDKVQLCAQALCLEEMLNVSIPMGALFYGATHRRVEVVFDEALREITTETARQLHQLTQYEKRCESCSLLEICLPKSSGAAKVAQYLDQAIEGT
jgi:CRISPR-associated exonuclease Cas4